MLFESHQYCILSNIMSKYGNDKLYDLVVSKFVMPHLIASSNSLHKLSNLKWHY